MPLPRQRQKGGDFPPFFLWLAKIKTTNAANVTKAAKAGLWRALLLSLVVHGAVLALPSSHHAARMPASRPIPASLEVRLPREAASVVAPEIAATVTPEANAQEVRPEEDAPIERGSVVSASHYFDSSEVDVKAEPIELAPLVYPEAAYIRRLSGVVTVRVYISDSGAIDAVDIVSADPPDMFEMAALDALLKTRFKPAELFGHPVASVKLVSINFDPQQDQPAQ
ncbi:MAG TPA: TonB family protein [Rhodocyclaceae bacterium]|nr:TonB family protein [Rhodocyclaceae bacterium]